MIVNSPYLLQASYWEKSTNVNKLARGISPYLASLNRQKFAGILDLRMPVLRTRLKKGGNLGEIPGKNRYLTMLIRIEYNQTS